MRTERAIDLDGLTDQVRLFGEYDRNLSAIEAALAVEVRAAGGRLHLSGTDDRVDRAESAVRRLLDAALAGAHIGPDDVTLALSDAAHDEVRAPLPGTLLRAPRGREIRPRTPGQRALVDAIAAHALTFGIGPAGTGKTFLAIVMAVRALKAHEVARVVLSRPAIEAGESLGFLPGDVREKVDPYMRPLFDALGELLETAQLGKLLERGVVEVAPLAYMRGRTLTDAFVILDEAQNATKEQLKMFLTRLGPSSRMVVTGDVTQTDLPSGAHSGLRDAARRLLGIEGVAAVELDERDVVRHPLVARIIGAYARP